MSKLARAIFPGSFDPLTLGHVDIITRALEFCEQVIVGVLANPSKSPLFTADERVDLIEQHFRLYGERVVAESFSGLLVDFAKEQKTRVLLRGLRATSDFDYEAQMALMNRHLSSEIETFFLMTLEKHSYISSSLVKQVAPLGGSVEHLVPPVVAEALMDKYESVA